MTPFNARVTADAPYIVPAGKIAEFHAFGSSITVDGVTIVDVHHAVQVGPLVAGAGAVISTSIAGIGLSGYLKDAEQPA